MARVGPGLTSLVVFVAACGATAARLTSTAASEPAKSPGGWYSSGMRPADHSSRNDDSVSRPVREDDRVPTPIVPYASTLFGSSRTDLPNVPAPLPAQPAYGAPQPWNVATPPVVDLGRDFGVAPPQGANQSPDNSPTTSTSQGQPAPSRAAEVRPPVTQDASPQTVVPVGPLVPVTLPATSVRGQEADAPKVESPVKPLTAEAMTPIKSQRVESGGKNAAPKSKPTTQAAEKQPSRPQARLETPGGVAPKSAAPKDAKPAGPVRFSLPQPAIPLESRRPHWLRKVLGS